MADAGNGTPLEADSPALAAASTVYVARQPIVDTRLRLTGYELLYRDGASLRASFAHEDLATYQVAVRALVDIGFDALVGPHFACVNVGEGILCDRGYRLLPADRTVLELVEHVTVDAGVVASAAEAVRLGYRLALDDYTGPSEHDRLGPYAAMVKVDVLEIPEGDLAGVVAHARRMAPGARIVAEKVETAEAVARCASLGCDLFQGYFVGRPELRSARQVPASSVAAVQLLAELQKPDVSLNDLCSVLDHDPVLAYRLLVLVNSAAFALSRQVTSLREALIMIGLDHARWLASVLTLTVLSGSVGHLSEQLVVRAKMCESVARAAGVADPSAAFTAGMFSGLPLVLGIPMDVVLSEVALSDPVADSLAGGDGPLADLIRDAVAYETGTLHSGGTTALPLWTTAFCDALAWAGRFGTPAAGR